ncbi:hypothetical protein Slin14017_G122440 [Septoria linicola]|nr:hypothetical protein Slin14017_G122440 [Septoria linicola]
MSRRNDNRRSSELPAELEGSLDIIRNYSPSSILYQTAMETASHSTVKNIAPGSYLPCIINNLKLVHHESTCRGTLEDRVEEVMYQLQADVQAYLIRMLAKMIDDGLELERIIDMLREATNADAGQSTQEYGCEMGTS